MDYAVCSLWHGGQCIFLCVICIRQGYLRRKNCTCKCQSENGLQSGPKVLDHSSIFIRDFPLSPFSMFIHTIHTGTDLTGECNIETGGGKGEFFLRQKFYNGGGEPPHFSVVNGWIELKKEAVQRLLVLIVDCPRYYTHVHLTALDKKW